MVSVVAGKASTDLGLDAGKEGNEELEKTVRDSHSMNEAKFDEDEPDSTWSA